MYYDKRFMLWVRNGSQKKFKNFNHSLDVVFASCGKELMS